MATSSSILLENSIIYFFFPLLVAVIGTQIWNFILEGKKKKAEKKEKLYGPIKFYLMLLENIDLNSRVLSEEMKKGTDAIKFENEFAKDRWQSETNQQLVDITKPNTDEALSHIEKIKELFESNPGLIEDEHWEVIKNFFNGYLKRKMLIAGGWPKKYIHLSTDALVNWADAVFEAIKELRKEILK